MADLTREEVDAKLDVISAQTDAKFERVLGEMRTANATVVGHLNTLGAQVSAAKDAANEAKAAAQMTRWQVFGIVIAGFASLIGVAALLLTNTGAITSLVQAAIAAKH